MRDQMEVLNPLPALYPVATDTGTTPLVGPVIDLAGYNSCTFAIVIGALAGSSAAYTVSVAEANNYAMTNSVASTLFSDAGLTDASFVLASADSVTKLGYLGTAQYVQLTITPNGSNSGCFVAAVAILGNPSNAPTPAIPVLPTA